MLQTMAKVTEIRNSHGLMSGMFIVPALKIPNVLSFGFAIPFLLEIQQTEMKENYTYAHTHTSTYTINLSYIVFNQETNNNLNVCW